MLPTHLTYQFRHLCTNKLMMFAIHNHARPTHDLLTHLQLIFREDVDWALAIPSRHYTSTGSASVSIRDYWYHQTSGITSRWLKDLEGKAFVFSHRHPKH